MRLVLTPELAKNEEPYKRYLEIIRTMKTRFVIKRSSLTGKASPYMFVSGQESLKLVIVRSDERGHWLPVMWLLQ